MSKLKFERMSNNEKREFIKKMKDVSTKYGDPLNEKEEKELEKAKEMWEKLEERSTKEEQEKKQQEESSEDDFTKIVNSVTSLKSTEELNADIENIKKMVDKI